MCCTTFDFLLTVQPPPFAAEQCELRLIALNGGHRRSFHGTVESLIDAALHQVDRYHALFGVSLRQGGGKAEHCTRLQSLYCDIDSKLWDATDTDPSSAALMALLNYPLPPTVVVGSGTGYHGYWRLDIPVDLRGEGVRERVEVINRAIARSVCGPDRMPDNVGDVSRVMRLPGSLNHKYMPPLPVDVTLFCPNRTYSLDAIEALLDDHYAWTLRLPSSTRTPLHSIARVTSSFAYADLGERARQRMSPRMRALLDTPGASDRRSPSEADWAVACSLLAVGLTEDDALSVLLASPRATDRAARKRQGERWDLEYWRRTVRKASAHVGPILMTPRPRPVLQDLSAPTPRAFVVLPPPARPLNPGMTVTPTNREYEVCP